jgi:hypothetical protein
VNVVGGGPITPVSVLGSVSSPDRRDLSFDGVETNIPLSSGYFGPITFRLDGTARKCKLSALSWCEQVVFARRG